jgi:hypothetical protein
VGVQAFKPGETLIAGDDQLGWYGEVEAADFITGSALAMAVGLSAGYPIGDDTTPWLGFNHQGRRLFVAKRGLRHSIDWNTLNSLGIVFGTTTVQIGEHTYKVRLITGGNTNPSTAAGGEWNDLLFRVSAEDPLGLGADLWADYTAADLGVGQDNPTVFKGTTCQEYHGSTSSVVIRGFYDVNYYGSAQPTLSSSSYVWRPVLELVP